MKQPQRQAFARCAAGVGALLAVLGAMLAGPSTQAAEANVASAQAARRAQLSQERKALEARFAQDSAKCREQFAATACVDEAKARQRAALAPLRDEQLGLDGAQRQARAQAKREALAARPSRGGASAPVLESKPAQPGPAHAASTSAAAPLSNTAPAAAATDGLPRAAAPAGQQAQAPKSKRLRGAPARSATVADAAPPNKATRRTRPARHGPRESVQQQQQRAEKARAAALRRQGAASAARERMERRKAARAQSGRAPDPLPVPVPVPVPSQPAPLRR